MRIAHFCVLSTIAALAASTARAQDQEAAPTALPARSERMVVTPDGVHLERQLGTSVPSAGAPENTTAGVAWTLLDGGLAWIGSAVSIGNRSSEVFTEVDLNNQRAMLLSSYDSNPPTPVWTDTGPQGTEFRVVASADATNTHVSTHQIVLNNNIQTRQAVLSTYLSQSPVPSWTYTFAPIINAASQVGISSDGETIVAAIYDNNQNEVEIAVFSPASNVPLSYTVVPVAMNDYMRGFDLSSDGSTLYYSAGVTVHIFDVATAMDVFSVSVGASFDSHAISGDGSVFAYGNFGQLRVWERSGATYLNTHNAFFPGQNYVAEIDISDDSSTIAYGLTYYGNYLTTQVEALDVATKQVTMTNTNTGSGGFQNIVSDVSISADGQRFAVGLWGDAAGLAPEVAVYDRGQDDAIFVRDLPGSVFDLEISNDGQRVTAGAKAVHANTFGNGGRVELCDLGDEDFALRTVPHIGANVTFHLYGLPNEAAVVARSLGELRTPTVFPGVGTLYIRRNTLNFFPLGMTDPNGFVSGTFQFPTDPQLIGTSLYFQGMTTFPRKLTKDWLKATIVP